MVLGFCASGAAVAQSSQNIIPKELLDLDYQRCENDCVPGFGEATCKPLCECTVSEFQKRLDYARYLDLSVQLSRGELKPESRELLDSIANHCTAELDRNGIPIGKPDAETKAPQQ
tara:strand:- start:543 stop:890 length:348 start_codon:yes stop_codon:yes gene_type:complete